MRRTVCQYGWLWIALAASVFAAPFVRAQDATIDPAEAQRRMTELAEKYAAPEPGDFSSRVADEQGGAEEPLAVEETPLGQAVDTDDALLGQGTPGNGWALSTFAALGLVVGLILLARWAYMKMGGRVVSRSTAAVEVLSRTSVAPKNHVLLLRVGQRVLVVGDSSSGLRTLADLDDPEEVASLLQAVTADRPVSVSKSFNSLMSRFNGEYEGRDKLSLEGGDEGEHHLDRTRDSVAGLSAKLKLMGGRGGGQ